MRTLREIKHHSQRGAKQRGVRGFSLTPHSQAFPTSDDQPEYIASEVIITMLWSVTGLLSSPQAVRLDAAITFSC